MRRLVLLLPCLLAACASAPPRALAPPAPPFFHDDARPPLATPAPVEAPPSPPPAAPDVDAPTARLVRLCRLWGEIRYLHPWVVEGLVDWDAALVAALPAAMAAQSDADEAAAVRTMLDALHDPATRVEAAKPPVPAAGPGAPAPPSRTVDGVVVAPVHADSWQDIYGAAKKLSEDLAAAKLAVVDLRGRSPHAGHFAQMAVDAAGSKLTSHDAATVAQRFVEHRGYRPQVGVTSGSYGTLLVSELPTHYTAAKEPHPSHVVFLVNAASGVPDVAWAMQSTGDGVVVVQGRLDADDLAATDVVPLSGGATVHVRRAEPVGEPPRPDVELDASVTDERAVAAAVRAALHPPARRRVAARPAETTTVSWHPDATYADATYPTRELRMLALFRFWNVIHRFYPYLPLMGDAWNEALVEMIPRFETAADVHDYQLAVTELAARIPDGHVFVRGARSLKELGGPGKAPFEVRVVEGHVVVTALTDDAALAGSGIAVGDVILTVGGEALDARMKRLGKYIAASNETWRASRAALNALTGEPGDKLALTLRDASGATRAVTVDRSKKWNPPERTGPVTRMLEGGIGYADLDRLEVADVDAMFKAFEASPAIVFDMRGYPHGTAWELGPRLNVRGARFAAQFFEPLVTVGSSNKGFFEQGIGGTDKPLYRGKTVMLIDERTMSQAEHTGLYLEAAAGTKFIGSQTAGANGDVTTLTLPGGLTVSFSGHDVRHADGRQLQRIGLVPDVEVHPTLAGLRAGRDEVLERALAFVRDGR